MARDPNFQPPKTGFHVSGKRAVAEIAGVVGGVLLGVYLLFSLAAWAAVKALPLIPTSADVAVGEGVWSQVTADGTRCSHPDAQAYVEAVAAPLIEALEDRRFEFTFAVVEASSINAFALPGGYIVVHHGLLQAAESGAEVAAVLAHEIHHVTQRHGFTRILRQASGYMAIGAVLGWLDVGALTVLATNLVSSGYERDQERESNRLGRALMVSARIDPEGMATFFERMRAEGRGGATWLSSHPGVDERIETARSGGAGVADPIELPSPKGVPCHVADTDTLRRVLQPSE